MTDFLAVAASYAAAPEEWAVAPRFNPVDRWYHRLAETADHEVWVLTWLPGQGTEIHDHGGSAGAFHILTGNLTEDTILTGDNAEDSSLTYGRGGDSGPDREGDAGLGGHAAFGASLGGGRVARVSGGRPRIVARELGEGPVGGSGRGTFTGSPTGPGGLRSACTSTGRRCGR